MKAFFDSWHRLFYEQDIKYFRVYCFAIYIYVFLFIGKDPFVLSDSRLAMWSPISFFKAMDLFWWRDVAFVSFYSLKIFSLLAAFGIFLKISRGLTFLSLLINVGFFMNFGKIFHGYHMLIMIVGLLSFMNSRFETKSNPIFQLIKIYVVLIYFMAGLNKLSYGGFRWVFSENLYRYIYFTPGESALARWLLEQQSYYFLIAAVLTVFCFQIPSILSLWSARWGYFIFMFASFFHISVHFIMNGHNRFLTQILCATVLLLPSKKD